ncbi:hypothetical protein TNCV_2537421 [Trichonephila clavipes]|nr:hypothetical protein TNCV_2537421 [Trichonephila clavipes]
MPSHNRNHPFPNTMPKPKTAHVNNTTQRRPPRKRISFRRECDVSLLKRKQNFQNKRSEHGMESDVCRAIYERREKVGWL